MFGVGKIHFILIWKSSLISPRLHLFDQKCSLNSTIVELNKQKMSILFSISIYLNLLQSLLLLDPS